MEINNANPVSNKVQGLETTPKVAEVKREEEEAASRQAEEENPDYRINLSEESKQAIAELNGAKPADQGSPNAVLTEDEAAQVAQQASGQLAQTNAAISNQAIQKAVDLFT